MNGVVACRKAEGVDRNVEDAATAMGSHFRLISLFLNH